MILRDWLRLPLIAFVLALTSMPLGAATLRSGDTELSFGQQGISVSRQGRTLIRLNSISFNYTHAKRWTVLRSDDTEIVLTGQFPAAAYFYSRAEDAKDLPVELTISREAGGFRLYAKPEWARQVTLELDYLGDHFFGLSEPLQPDNRRSPDLTGGSTTVDVASEGESLHENYASAFSSFYMSTAGYGAFFDSFARGRYDFNINGRNRIHHDTGTLDWHILPGADGREIHAAYFALIGQPKSVPAWAMGPTGWRDQNNGGAPEILADIEQMNALKIPFTAWFVDRPYSDGAHGWSQLNFSKAFASPAQWIGKLRNDYGLEFMTWTTTATFGDTSLGKHLPGKFSYLDLTDAKSVRAYEDGLKAKQHAVGVKGHKIDRADEGFPVYEDWQDTSVQTPEKRNKYTYLMTKIHDDVLRESWGDDQVTFTRSAIHRTQPYLSAIWAGDPRTNWDGLRSNFANAARSSFMGFPVWGTDVGGYQGEGHIPEDLYIRWMQAGSMSGLFEVKLDGAGGEGRHRMPWAYDEHFQQIFRSICEDRMRLVPYLYSLAHTSGRTGTLMQPLAYRHLADAKTYDNWDQFYLGDAILVAPVFDPGTTRSVYLPKGQWRDFNRPAQRYQGGTTIRVEAPLDVLPRFLKENSLYVSGNIYAGNDRLWNTSAKLLVVHAFPGSSDSGTEFTYIDMLDRNVSKSIQLRRAKRGIKLTSPAMTHAVRIDVLLDAKPVSVTLNGVAVAVNYQPDTATLSVAVPQGQPCELQVVL